MLKAPARLLRLLSLLQARRQWPGHELAERLEITARTLRRDVDRLRSLGYPVHACSGVAGGYQLGAGASLPPLHLADDEALAVVIGLRTATGSTVLGIEEAALRALVKLEQVLPERLRRRANALRSSIMAVERRGASVDATLLSTLAGACRDHEELRFRYDDRRAQKTERVVEPHGIVHTGLRWYMVAWDRLRDDFRTFRIDRIAGKVAVGARFLPRPSPNGGDLSGYVARSLSLGPYSARARVIVHAPLEAMVERIPPTAGILERLDDRRCMLSTGAHSLDWLAAWLLMIGEDFEVVEPLELHAHLEALRTRLERILASGSRVEAPPTRAARARATAAATKRLPRALSTARASRPAPRRRP
jgi:predicted DNA-binding transcriptional regulator YafY